MSFLRQKTSPHKEKHKHVRYIFRYQQGKSGLRQEAEINFQRFVNQTQLTRCKKPEN